MKLIDQVCSLDLSNKLKNLGVKQNSLFFWNICHDCVTDYPPGSVNWVLTYEEGHGENVSAFTVGELGEILPYWFDSAKRDNGEWVCRVKEKNSDINHYSFESNEANARAKMIIFLLENNLIDISEINRRVANENNS